MLLRACVVGGLLIAAQASRAQQSLGLGPSEGALKFAQQVGQRFTVVCPASDGTRATVYGTDIYTADSPVCAAAIHAGVLQPGRAGAVSIDIGSGAKVFEGSTRNGVTTRSYGRWGASYTFARGGEWPACVHAKSFGLRCAQSDYQGHSRLTGWEQ